MYHLKEMWNVFYGRDFFGYIFGDLKRLIGFWAETRTSPSLIGLWATARSICNFRLLTMTSCSMCRTFFSQFPSTRRKCIDVVIETRVAYENGGNSITDHVRFGRPLCTRDRVVAAGLLKWLRLAVTKPRQRFSLQQGW